jgi:membrane fusion protein, multidrug efflux system
MKKTFVAIALVAIGIVVGGVASPLLQKFRTQAASNAPAKPSPNTINPAEATLEFARSDLMTISQQNLEKQVTLTGSLKPANQTIVKSKTSGEIRDILVREGSEVKKGQVLVHIDPSEFELRLREREALLRQSQSALEQAKRTFDNNRALVEKNFISQTALDNSRAQMDSAVSSKDAALANLTLAKRALADTVITAPIPGTIGERFAQPGEKVSPDNRVLSIVDLNRMELEASVPAGDISKLTVGQSVEVQIEGIAQAQRGTLARISPATASGSRSVPVYIAVDAGGIRLRGGLFAQASLPVDKKIGVLAIPLSAVRDNGGRTFVYIVKANKLEERVVSLGLRDDNAKAANGSIGMVEITKGLETGDSVVAANLGILRVGSAVKLSSK